MNIPITAAVVVFVIFLMIGAYCAACFYVMIEHFFYPRTSELDELDPKDFEQLEQGEKT